MGAWFDQLPSQEREKIRRRLRSPEEYERLREKVRGPEDLEREMEKNAEFAEARLTLESEPEAHESARDAVRSFVAEQSMEAGIEGGSEAVRGALESGRFNIAVVDHASSEPRLALQIRQDPSSGVADAPMGNVQETFPLTPALQQKVFSVLKKL